MRITIFGGGGFIGSAITDRLLLEGHLIRIFERPRVLPYRTFSSNERIEWVTGDLMSCHDVKEAIVGADTVIHLVSTTVPKNSDDDPIYDVQSNLVSTLQMLDVISESNVSRIIFISSGGTVYGPPAYLPIDEKHPTNPQVSYGITKLGIEKHLLLFCRRRGVRPIILRVSNPYGERQRIETAQGVLAVFLWRILNDQPIEIWGDGNIKRDFLHVSDVADAFCKSLGYLGEHSIFNISSGVGVSLKNLVELLEKVLRKKATIEYKATRRIDVDINFLSNELASQELGWKPKVPLEDGVQRTLQWMQNSKKTGEPL